MHDSTTGVVAIVDDDLRVRDAIQRLLCSAGFSAAKFPSAEDFLQSGTLAATKCLIADVRMPGMSGLELQRRAKWESPGLTVVIITGHGDTETEHRALREGAACFLYKPVDTDTLLDIVRTALNAPREND